MEKYQLHLQESIKALQLADHITYVTYPLVKEQRLLLKIFDEIYKSVTNSINAILYYETLYKRIKLYNNTNDNLQTFENKCAKSYNLSNEQVKKIIEIIDLNKKHKQSAMEFVKQEKVIIMSDNLSTNTLDLQIIKDYLLLSKELLLNINKKINPP